jgi:hypothetical protein
MHDITGRHGKPDSYAVPGSNPRSSLKIARAIFVFLASYLAILVLLSQFGPLYFKLFAGLFRLEIDLLYPPLKVATLQMETYNGQEMISLEARMRENVVLEDGVVLHTKGRPYIAKTIAIGEYLHPLIVLSILVAWPGLRWRDRCKVLLLLVPFLLLVEMVDIPILLATRCRQMMQIDLYNDLQATSTLGSFWIGCLHAGGREALSILAISLALGCFYLGRWRRCGTAAAAAGKAAKNQLASPNIGRKRSASAAVGKKL